MPCQSQVDRYRIQTRGFQPLACRIISMAAVIAPVTGALDVSTALAFATFISLLPAIASISTPTMSALNVLAAAS